MRKTLVKKDTRYIVQLWMASTWEALWEYGTFEEADRLKKESDRIYPSERHRIIERTVTEEEIK